MSALQDLQHGRGIGYDGVNASILPFPVVKWGFRPHFLMSELASPSASSPPGPSLPLFSSFVGMAQTLLLSWDAEKLLEHVQHKQMLAMVAAGFSVGVWRVADSLDDTDTLVASASALPLNDPLSGDKYELLMRMAMTAARNGCMLSMSTEVCRLPERNRVVRRTPLLFLSWDETGLPEQAERYRAALASLAARPENLFADTDFHILPRQMTEELAP